MSTSIVAVSDASISAPKLATDDPADASEIDAVFSPKGAVRDASLRVTAPNILDLGERQLCAVVTLALPMSTAPLTAHVGHVFTLRTQKEVVRVDARAHIALVEHL